MSYEKSVSSTVYKEVIKALEAYDQPAVGFSKLNSVVAVVKQNNFIIQLLLNIKEDLEDCKDDINSLKKEIAVVSKGKGVQKDFTQALDEITKKLESTKFGEQKPAKKKGPFYVYEDPLKILEKEQVKLKKK